jgi:hypothetical protein
MVANKPEEQIQALEEQIGKLREIRRRWAEGEGLSPKERATQGLTVELLDGAIGDLIKRRSELERSGN